MAQSKEKKRFAWVHSQVSGRLTADRLLYKAEVDAHEQVIKQAKAHYEERLVDQIKDNPKVFWNYTRHFTCSSSTVETIISGNTRLTKGEDKAELLNEHFSSVTREEPPIDFALPEDPSLENILLDFDISPEQVRSKLLKLKANKGSGPDNININFLRQCPDLDFPLSSLFNKSLSTGRLPQDWRDANICPLFKKGSRTDVNNYRPVALTSQIVKLLERLFQDHILNLISLNKTLNCNQHGFQDKCSCVTQLLECMNDWTDNWDKALETDIIYLDFCKAFDSVPHNRLILKIKQLGIRRKVLYWIKNFLCNRRNKLRNLLISQISS